MTLGEHGQIEANNAQLVAAAPDLYEALYNLLAEVKLPIPANLLLPAELALAKARGEQTDAT